MRQIIEIESKEGYIVSIVADGAQSYMVKRGKELLKSQNVPMTFDMFTNVKTSEPWRKDKRDIVKSGTTLYNCICMVNNSVYSKQIRIGGVKSAYNELKREMNLSSDFFMVAYDVNQKAKVKVNNKVVVEGKKKEEDKKKEEVKGKKSSKELATRVVNNRDVSTLNKILTKAASKVKGFPVLGPYMEDIVLLFSLVEDCIKGNYKEVPVGTLVAIIATVIYFVSPIDLVPDVIPGLGQLDDAGVLIWALNTFHGDIAEYKEWKNTQ